MFHQRDWVFATQIFSISADWMVAIVAKTEFLWIASVYFFSGIKDGPITNPKDPQWFNCMQDAYSRMNMHIPHDSFPHVNAFPFPAWGRRLGSWRMLEKGKKTNKYWTLNLLFKKDCYFKRKKVIMKYILFCFDIFPCF